MVQSQFERRDRMKTCVSSYSFASYTHQQQKTQRDLIALAKSMGFDAIEFTDLCSPDGMTDAQYAEVLREESEKHGLPIVNYTIGADFLNCGDVQREIARVCGQAEIAKTLGASGMRHDATVGYRDARRTHTSFDAALPALVAACKAVTAFAETCGVQTMIENHGTFCQESARVERVIGGVNDPNFGWLVDVGNFLCADEDPASAVGRAAPFAKHVHVKDFHVKSGDGFDPGRGFFRSRGGAYLRGAVLGQGNVPVVQCLRTLAAQGYDGYVSIEFEGVEDNLPALETGLENLRRMLEIIR